MPSLIRYCDSPRCGEELPSDSAKSRRYCDATCRSAARYWRDKQRRAAPPDDRGELVREQRNWKPNKAINTITADVRDNLETYARRGGVYRRLRDAPEILDALIAGDPEMTLTVAGEMLGVSSTAIRRALAAIMADLDTEEAADAWNMDVDYERMLGRDDGIDLDELTDLFVEWRDTFMTDEKGEPYITKDFHRKWIRAILGAIRGGERKMILSPPRHGKTQLLIDFCTWQIVRNPNVRIVWIASIEDLAKDWLAAIQDQLDNNEKLRAAYLRPGEDFKPAHRSGKTWSRSQFTVATRTVTGIKSPTMQSVGRSGRILSRDVDFMIVDDIEDHGSTVQPANRESTRKWFAQDSGSRKEEHTAVIVIGSRQHPDDLYGHLLTNPEWESIVEEAHQGTCPLPKQPEEAHVECMLFPEKRSYSWFLAQQRSFAITGGDA
ncbi:MAG: hypothetical protein R3324_06370, partial [Halobacteriales archaeon]|nr:hypothetical protein [Halobacteriales archaeon]